MAYTLHINPIGVNALREKLKNIRWFVYRIGVNDIVEMGAEKFLAHVQLDSPSYADLKESLSTVLEGEISTHSSNYLDIKVKNIYVMIRKTNESKNYYLLEVSIGDLEYRFQEEDFATLKKLDDWLDSLKPSPIEYAYSVEPIYGDAFMAKDLLIATEHTKQYPKADAFDHYMTEFKKKRAIEDEQRRQNEEDENERLANRSLWRKIKDYILNSKN